MYFHKASQAGKSLWHLPFPAQFYTIFQTLFHFLLPHPYITLIYNHLFHSHFIILFKHFLSFFSIILNTINSKSIFIIQYKYIRYNVHYFLLFSSKIFYFQKNKNYDSTKNKKYLKIVSIIIAINTSLPFLSVNNTFTISPS